MKRSFANLIAKKESGGGDGGTNVFNISVASSAGEARVPAKNISLPATDVCDYALPNLEVTVISAKPHYVKAMHDHFMVTALVNKVKAQDNGFSTTFDLPSGASVVMALKKAFAPAMEKEMVAKPHALADKFALIPCSGVVDFMVKGKNNGPNGTDLRIEEHLLPGSMVEVVRFSADAKLINGEFNVFCSASTVSPLLRPPFVTMRPSSVVDKCFENATVHREAFINIARGTGEAQHPVLVAWLKKDIEYLLPKLEGVKRDFKDRKVGIGKPFETLAMSADAEDGIDNALAWMNMYLEEPDDNLPTSCDIIDELTKINISKIRFAPFLQSASGPFDKAALGCMQTGMGPLSTEFSYGEHTKHPQLQFYTEALISSTKKPAAVDKSVGSLELNVVSAFIAVKHPETGEWTGMVPKLKSNTAVCLGQLTSSGRCKAAPALQTFDYGRMPIVANEIVPYAPMVLFLRRMAVNNTKVCDTAIQPQNSSDWGDGSVLDYVSGIRNAGVQVSVEFVDDHLCDDGEVLSMDASKLYNYVDVDSSKEAKAPTKHRFEVTGFNGLNCFEETKIKKFRLKQNMPPGGENIEYFAIFDGSSDAVMGDPDLNTDMYKGCKFIADKLAADKTFAKEKMALYAIAVASSPDGKSEATDEPEANKAKNEAESDSE